VGDAARHATYRLELLRLHELLFEPAMIRDVTGHASNPIHVSVLVAHRIGASANPAQ
jgi:hypothetical protein